MRGTGIVRLSGFDSRLRRQLSVLTSVRILFSVPNVIERGLKMLPRFDDCRAITAKYPGKSNMCGAAVGGHEIRAGDVIGYARRKWSQGGGQSFVMCAVCWSHWVEENRLADAIAAGYMPNCL